MPYHHPQSLEHAPEFLLEPPLGVTTSPLTYPPTLLGLENRVQMDGGVKIFSDKLFV